MFRPAGAAERAFPVPDQAVVVRAAALISGIADS